jgi:ethanolamine ammonia-lyase small subunit
MLHNSNLYIGPRHSLVAIHDQAGRADVFAFTQCMVRRKMMADPPRDLATGHPLDQPLDPWGRLRAATRARIGLARAGDGLTTEDLLDFQLAHARARDAVHRPVDFDALAQGFAGQEVIRLRSAAPDRVTYLQRPDLGRRLDPASRAILEQRAAVAAGWQIAIIIADGLSCAIEQQALPLLAACESYLSGLRVAPLILAEQARVALGDEIGGLLGVDLTVMLIGERPGLSVANSLGVYLTWRPRPGRSDAERNCLSNIHAEGLSSQDAAARLCWLIDAAMTRQLSGVALKDDSGRAALPPIRSSE